MADLDDLFGAFDGNDDKKESSSQKGGDESDAPEKSSQVEASSKKSKNNLEDDVVMDEASKGNSKSVYTALMTKPVASHVKEETDADADQRKGKNNTGKRREEEKKEDGENISGSKDEPSKSKTIEDESKRQIATGTSHDKSVRSYSAYPKNLPPGTQLVAKKPPKEPAKKYAFTLDPFQQQAVGYIDIEESVLVAAHTSAGKTAVAEYAIAKSLKNGQRVVYTSPIKALSNQKFRDLQEEFSDVGLMTGDITINPSATVLVMTTEILRSMLYRGSELMREVAWVIYDEVHYMRDSERGVVWEESIILLPDAVKFVFLSATIPNAEQFADWIAEIHHQPCHVVYTNYRPVPLQHYIFPQGGEGLHLVVDERGKFREANFQRAMTTLQSGSTEAASAQAMLNSGEGGGGGGRKRKRGSSNAGKKQNSFSDLHRIVKLVMERNLNPVIVFSFSKKDCEKYALALNKEDYTDDVEKDLISQVYINAIDSLGEDDRKLPQVQALLPLLKRGIGIHHGGLLPILKEIVEILFSEGLIKTLFATETFSIGINMPAKTVVFTNTRKWDGKDFRWVTSGEYIQMSGRAGRRGKDDRGIVIQMLDEKMEPNVCKGILYGEPDPLNSSYRISYNMLLNLMRVEDVDPEYLLRASFHQFQRERDAPHLLQQAEELDQKANDAFRSKSDEETQLVSEYYQMEQQLGIIRQKIKSSVQKPEYILKYLQQSGRFVCIEIENQSYGWGILVNSKKKNNPKPDIHNTGLTDVKSYSIDVLLACVDRHFDKQKDGKIKDEDLKVEGVLWKGNHESCRPKTDQDSSKMVSMRVFTVGLQNIERISAVRIFVPQDYTLKESRKKISISMKEVQKRFPDGIPLLDPIKDMGIEEVSFKTLLSRAEALNERLSDHNLTKDYEQSARFQLIQSYEKKIELQEQAKVLREEARSCQTIAMKEDLKKMKRVLKRLGHVDANGVIQTKGRTACEINTADELVVVELIFTGVFNDLTCEQCVALLSCMTFDERVKDDDDGTAGMKNFFLQPFHKLREVARTVAQTQIACNIEQDEEEFVNKYNCGMMEAVFAWCKGAKFVEVQKLTGTFEGTTIRTLRRLEELIRQIASACKAIGNQELQAKFDKAGELIKRDIVFCSSLYL